jgi:hypothetical protein
MRLKMWHRIDEVDLAGTEKELQILILRSTGEPVLCLVDFRNELILNVLLERENTKE